MTSNRRILGSLAILGLVLAMFALLEVAFRSGGHAIFGKSRDQNTQTV